MAAPTGTFQTYSATTNREDLQNWIANISPTDSPFKSMIGEAEAKDKKHEWSQDELAAASTSNAQVEGDDIPGSTSAAPSRIENYCQISSKDITVSRSQRKSNMAGAEDFYDYQVVKKGREILRDMEAILTGNQGYVQGNATLARKLRSLESWISTNQNLNSVTTTAAGALTSASTPGKEATAATLARTDANVTRPFAESYLKEVIRECYTEGGAPSVLMVGPYNKQIVSSFAGRTSARENVSVGTILGAAQVYASDFGDLRVVPNRFQRDRSAFVLDTEYWAVAYFDRLQEEAIAKTGDADKTLLVVEYTLEAKQQKSSGGIFDLSTS